MPSNKIIIQYGFIEAPFAIPDDFIIREKYNHLLRDFNKNISGFAPSSPAELIAKYLGYAATVVDINTGVQFDSFVRHILDEFHRLYLRGQDIDDLASSLMRGDVNSGANRAIKENLVKNYYIAVVKCNFQIVPNYTFNGNNPRKFVVCFGQGNTNYFEVLVDLLRFYGALVPMEFLRSVCFKELERNESVGPAYPQGLDWIYWVSNPEKRPDINYLMTAPVSCPLIAVTQLVHYCVECKSAGLTPGEYNKYAFSGAIGHGQGIVTALAIAESDSWESFYVNARKAVLVMFSIGVYIGLQDSGNGVVVSGMRYDCIRNGEGIPTPMLLIRGLTLHQVESFVTEVNKKLLESQHISISLFNGPTNFAVTGPKESLYFLNLIMRKSKASEGSSKFSYKFLPIYAPFHSYLLRDIFTAIDLDLEEMEVEYYSKDLKMPVYDTHNGANLQEYDRTHDEETLNSRIIKLIIELPVHWEAATKVRTSTVYIIGQGDAFELFD